MESTHKKKNSAFITFVRTIEKAGNRFPHPFVLFIISSIIILLVAHYFDGVTFQIPGEDSKMAVNSLLNREGFVYMLTHILKNFASFPLIPLIISLTLAIGVGEKAGLYKTLIIKCFKRVSDKHLTFLFFFIAINSNLISDAALILMPQIGAILFKSRGRNPMIGIILSYTGFLAGLSANTLIAGTDALVAGITQTVTPLLSITRGVNVHAASNWYFMFVSAIILAFFGTLVTEKIVVPMLNSNGQELNDNPVNIHEFNTTKEENRGLKWAGLTAIVFIVLILIALIPAGGFLRDPITQTILPTSPFIKSIIPLLTFFFLAVGIMYGLGAGSIRSTHDIAKGMTSGVETIAGVLVVFFFAAQFVDYFSKTNLATFIAINGAQWLNTNNFTGIPLLISIIIFVSVINFFVGTVGAKWAMLAPVLVPMLALLGYHPAFAQCVYRIGDAVTNTINPINVYLPIVLGYMKIYNPKAGIGTVIAYQIPYALTFLLIWTIQLIIWYLLKLPLGPVSPILL